MQTITQVQSCLTWNAPIQGIGFTHRYKGAEGLGIVHTMLEKSHADYLPLFHSVIEKSLSSRSYKIGSKIINTTLNLQWFQIIIDAGEIVKLEAVVTVIPSEGSLFNDHYMLKIHEDTPIPPGVHELTLSSEDRDNLDVWIRDIHSNAHHKLGLNPQDIIE